MFSIVLKTLSMYNIPERRNGIPSACVRMCKGEMKA